MTTQNISLKDFETQNKIKKELKVKVREWTEQYCDAIEQNYKEYHIRTLNGNLHGNYPEYAQKQLDEIKNGTANLMWFKVYSGKKYYKIVQQEFETWEGSKYYGQYRDASVHSFVDKKTGQIYMPASWRGPAKHVRYDMRIIKEREYVLNPRNCGWAGGYLYLR